MRLPLFTTALVAPMALCPVLITRAEAQTTPPAVEKLARADDEARGVLWGNASLDAPTTGPSQKDVMEAATKSFGLLSSLRSFRSSFGSNASSKRELFNRSLNGQKFALSMGSMSSPSLAGISSSGLSASYGFFEMGTSLRLRGVDDAVSTFDSWMNGTQVAKPTDEKDMMWMRAKPWQAKQGELELTWMSAARDTTPTASGGDKRGMFWGGKGRLALPMGWSLNGDWTQAKVDDAASQSEDNGDNRMKWNASAAGPISHPFGEAKASLEWHETDAGFSTLTGSNTNGESVGQAQLIQDVKLPLVQGQFKLVTSRRARLRTQTANAGEELENFGANGTAQAKIKVLPNLSINVNGTVDSTQRELAEANFASEGDATENEILTQSGDIGVEWKAPGNLSLNLSTGRSQTNQRSQSADADDWDETPEQAENRVTASLRHQRSDGLLGIQLAARNRAGAWASTTSDERWQRLATVRLEAEQKVIGDFKIRTILDIARDRDADWGDDNSLARRAEAQFTFTRATRLDLKFRDGAALPSGWLSNSMGSPFGSVLGSTFQTGDREFGAQFNTGSAANGKGLGLSVGFTRAQHSGSAIDTDTWKVGLTYR